MTNATIEAKVLPLYNKTAPCDDSGELDQPHHTMTSPFDDLIPIIVLLAHIPQRLAYAVRSSLHKALRFEQ